MHGDKPINWGTYCCSLDVLVDIDFELEVVGKSLWGILVNVKYPLPTLKRWNVMHHIPWSHRWDAAF